MEALTRSPWNPSRRCTATNRAGTQCARQPIPGGEVCVLHGGAAPQVQQSAKTRLLAMVEPVLATLEEILNSWHPTTCVGCGHVDEKGVKCTGCGRPTGDPSPVIRIGQLVLDRAGFHPTLAVEHVEQPNEFDDASIDEVIEQLETMLAEAIAMRDDQRAHTLSPAIDADFIEPDDDDAIQHSPVQIPVENETPDEGKDDK